MANLILWMGPWWYYCKWTCCALSIDYRLLSLVWHMTWYFRLHDNVRISCVGPKKDRSKNFKINISDLELSTKKLLRIYCFGRNRQMFFFHCQCHSSAESRFHKLWLIKYLFCCYMNAKFMHLVYLAIYFDCCVIK